MTSSSDGQNGPPAIDNTAEPATMQTSPRPDGANVADSNTVLNQPSSTDVQLENNVAPEGVQEPQAQSASGVATENNAPPSLKASHDQDATFGNASLGQPTGNAIAGDQTQTEATQILLDATEGKTEVADQIMIDAPAVRLNSESANEQTTAATIDAPSHGAFQDSMPHNTEDSYPSSVQQMESNVRHQTPTKSSAGMTAPISESQAPPPPSTPFTPVAMSNMNPHAYMMMALAMSGPPPAISPPPTVTPSQVTLPPNNGLATDHDPYFPNGVGFPAAQEPQPTEDTHLECFARLEFADSVFQITTYAVMIGRDQKAFEVARVRERRDQEYQRKVREHEELGIPPPDPLDNEPPPRFSKSYVSEEGGMLGPASADDEDDASSQPPPKRRKRSHVPSEHDEEDQALGDVISNRQYVSHTPGAAAVDLKSLRPSLDHVPFIGIHSPGPDTASKTKAISREHLKIAFNRKEMFFEAFPMHKNGFFRQDEHYSEVGQPVILKCGDRIQIKDVEFQFIIPGVEKGKHGAEGRNSSRNKKDGGKEMSFEFEGSRSYAEMHETTEESLSELEDSLSEMSDIDRQLGASVDEENQDDGAMETEAPSELMPDGDDRDVQMMDSSYQDGDPSLPQLPKKRGPGRPPKNGIMSKREQRLLKKQQQEMAKKTVPETEVVDPTGDQPLKRKVGRPRKHPLPEDGGTEKRKYKPRKPREDGAEGSDAERKAKEKKDKKVRPKSPPLDLKIEDYTDEQLQKPNKNYGVLIDETLTAAPDGLTLKQIYKRICQRYPWFFFHTETKGWESSVRHNLIGNEAFKKDEATNLWSRVPGVELDAGKKRKPTSPDRHLAQLGYGHYPYGYNNGRPVARGPQGIPPGPPHPAYPVPGNYNNQPPPPPPVRPAQFGNTGPSGPPSHPPAHANMPAQMPGYGPPPPAGQAHNGGQPPGAYNSPYAQRPPPVNPAIKTEDGAMAHGMHHDQHLAGKAPAHPVPHQQGVAPSQNSAQAPMAPGRPSEPPQPPKSVIDPLLLNAVVSLREGLLTNLKKARNPQADELVFSAINRSFGLKSKASENHKMEDICIKGINQVVQGYLKGKTPAPGQTSTPPPGANQADWAEAVRQWDAAPKIMDFQPFYRIMGFKKVTIQTLGPTLGADVAEAIALSSIDRALGLLSASVPAASKPVDKNGKEIPVAGIENGLIKSMRQMLLGLGYSAPGTGTGATPTPTPTPQPQARAPTHPPAVQQQPQPPPQNPPPQNLHQPQPQQQHAAQAPPPPQQQQHHGPASAQPIPQSQPPPPPAPAQPPQTNLPAQTSQT